MKWSGGPIVARARVQGFRQIEHCTPEKLRSTTGGFRLHDLEQYWAALPPYFFGMTIYLEAEEWLDHAIMPSGRSRGESWIVVDTVERHAAWLQAGQPDVQVPIGSVSDRRQGGGAISASLRFEILRRDGFTCTYCGRKPPDVRLHVDHVFPRVKGGTSDPANLRTACSECSLGKGGRSLSESVSMERPHGEGPAETVPQ